MGLPCTATAMNCDQDCVRSFLCPSLSLSASLQAILLIMQLRVCTDVTVARVSRILSDMFVQIVNKRGVYGGTS